MQEAGLMNFLRTILILALIYYGFKLIARYVFPLIIKRFVSNVEQKVREQQGYTAKKTQTKVGETTVERAPKQNTSNNSVGEYVDFEEID